mmetsp:Transcript_3029/g.8003  ORF Transcript_3029/g.8003 Transcript_3029/m.8003 type:complete len:227 (-) Transcript_3029:587-1267(-)
MDRSEFQNFEYCIQFNVEVLGGSRRRWWWSRLLEERVDAFLDDAFDDEVDRGVVVGAGQRQRFQQEARRLGIQRMARRLENVQGTQRMARHAIKLGLRLNAHFLLLAVGCAADVWRGEHAGRAKGVLPHRMLLCLRAGGPPGHFHRQPSAVRQHKVHQQVRQHEVKHQARNFKADHQVKVFLLGPLPARGGGGGRELAFLVHLRVPSGQLFSKSVDVGRLAHSLLE